MNALYRRLIGFWLWDLNQSLNLDPNVVLMIARTAPFPIGAFLLHSFALSAGWRP